MEINIVYISGGLGNQMFQYAFYKRLSRKNRPVYITYERAINEIHTGYSLSHVFRLKPRKAPEILRVLAGTQKPPFKQIRNLLIKAGLFHHYKPDFGVYIPMNPKPGMNIYHGYWQSEKYFQDIEAEIRRDFEFTEIREEKNLNLLKIMKDHTSISIHVRRGDYLQCGLAFSDSAMRAYYQNAMEYLCGRVKNAIFLIFSNDINWCKDNILPPPGRKSYFCRLEYRSREL